jgi:hypothetical protein
MGPNGRFSELPAGDFVAQALWTKLATAVASNSATIDFTGLSSSYNAYKVVLSNVAPATNSVNLYLRTSTNNGSSYDAGASDYYWGVFTVTAPNGGTGGTGPGAGTAAAQMRLNFSALGNGANKATGGIVYIYRPSAAAYCQVNWMLNSYTDGLFLDQQYGGGVRLAAADVDAIRFLMSSGNIAAGQFDLYGLAF